MHHLSQNLFPNSLPLLQPPINDKLRLPTELLILISSFVRQRNDLVTLCRVSKEFRIICTPLLYRVVTVDTSIERANSPYWLYLYKMLQDPITSLLVTHLDFGLTQDRFCGRRYQPDAPIIYPQHFYCSCIGYDDALRKAIVSLRNLESLTIHCTLCPDSHSHDYLFDLQAPVLRQFSFRCSARPGGISILFLPCMRQVTSLFLNCDNDHIRPNSLQALVEGNDVAPNLHTLNMNGDSLYEHLLGHRPVERLCLNTSHFREFGRSMDGLHASISQSPGTLSHLFVVDALQWLPRVIEADLEPYRHLRCIGTVTLMDPEDASTLGLAKLAPLCNLEVMEVNQLRSLESYGQMGPHDMFHPVQGFFEILGDRHPLLRRVLLICRLHYKKSEASIEGADPILWEKADGQSWTSRPVPRLDYWDIIHDKLDEV